MSTIVEVLKTTNDKKIIEKAIKEFFNKHALEMMEARKKGILAEVKEERISIAQCHTPDGSTASGSIITTIIIQQIF